jgi:hypothetical protein
MMKHEHDVHMTNEQMMNKDKELTVCPFVVSLGYRLSGNVGESLGHLPLHEQRHSGKGVRTVFTLFPLNTPFS